MRRKTYGIELLTIGNKPQICSACQQKGHVKTAKICPLWEISHKEKMEFRRVKNKSGKKAEGSAPTATAEAEVGAEAEQGGVPLTAATARPAYPSPSAFYRTRITTCPACPAETGPYFAPE